MTSPNNIENDFYALFSRFMLEQDNDTPHRLSEQDDALKTLLCSQPDLGKWIRECDFPFLMETLMLDDTVFAKEFPGAKLTEKDRTELSNALQLHCETCDFCSRKRAYDLEWQWRVDKAFAENRQAIGQAIASVAGKKI